MSEIIKIAVTALITFIATYLNERRKEKLSKIKCTEIINKKVIDIGLPSMSMSNSLIFKTRDNPLAGLKDIKEIYTAVFLIKNVGTKPMGSFVLKALRDKSMPLWFRITLGKRKNPDWDNKLKKLLNETKENEEIGWTSFFIPYLNPYRSSKEIVFLIITSYLSLEKIKICGGSEGMSFKSKKMKLFRNSRSKIILKKNLNKDIV